MKSFSFSALSVLHFWPPHVWGFSRTSLFSQFSVDTVSVSRNLISFWRHVRGVSADPTGKGLSPRLAPTTASVVSARSGLSPVLRPPSYRSEVPTSLWLSDLLERLTEVWGTVRLPDYLLVTEGPAQEHRTEQTHGPGVGVGAELPCPLQVHQPPRTSGCCPARSSLNPFS